MTSIRICFKSQAQNLYEFHINRFKRFFAEKGDDVTNDKFNLSEDEIDKITKLKDDIKISILNNFISSETTDLKISLSAIFFISIQYFYEKYQIELAISALCKCLQNDIPVAFNQEIFDQLWEYMTLFIQNGDSRMIQNSISIFNIFVKKYSKQSDPIILSEIVHSNFPKILLKCDMKLKEISRSFWYLLQIQFDENTIFCDQVYDEEELQMIMQNCIHILNNFSLAPMTQMDYIDKKNQIEKVQKYIFKCVSIFPYDFDFDCLIIDIITRIASDHQSFQIKEMAIKTSIKRNIKSMHLCNICLNQIKILITMNETQRKTDKVTDNLFLVCLNYLNISFDCWLNNNNSDLSENLGLIVYIIEYIIDNKSFKFVSSALPIAEKIINKKHWIDMKLEEMLINHIDISEIGKICLITSFMATGNMPIDQFCESLQMYIEIFPILDDLYNSDQCDQLTAWIIEIIRESVSKFYEPDLEIAQ